MYESEITKFMREFLAQNPKVVEDQKRGRALWWDKPQDLDTQRRHKEAKVPQKPYYYQSEV